MPAETGIKKAREYGNTHGKRLVTSMALGGELGI